mgnify:CR=1 FL=1
MSQVNNNKRIAKNTMYLYARMFLVMAISLITVRVLLQTLGVADYGTYNAVAGFVSSLVFISSVLSAASQRFFSFYIGKNDKVRLQKAFAMIILTYLIVIGIIIIVAETVGVWFVLNKMTIPAGRESAVMWVFQMALLTCTFSLISNPFQALIISHEEMNIYASISIIEVILKLGIIFILPLFSMDKLALYAVLHCMVFAGISFAYIIISHRRYKEARFTLNWDKAMFKDIFSYSSWSLFGSLAGMCNTQGVNMLLNVFYGPIANAAYAISAQISAAVNQFSSNFYTAVRPALIKSYASKDFHYMNKLFMLSNKVVFILMLILILPIYVITEPLVKLWLGNVEQYMVEFTRLSLVYTFILCLSNPITTIVQAANKVKYYHGIVDTFTLLSLPVIYFLFRDGVSPIYAYITTIIVFALAHIMRLMVLSKTIDFSIRRYFQKFIIPSSFAIVLSSAFVYPLSYISWNNNFCEIVISTLIAVMIAVVTSSLCVLNNEERRMILELIKNKIKKK